jgi:hypothetical protein
MLGGDTEDPLTVERTISDTVHLSDTLSILSRGQDMDW